MYHFKNKEDYLTQRQAIIDEAQNLINEGKIDEANKKTEEVNGLDEAFEAYAKAQANLSALNNPAPTNIISEGKVIDKMDPKAMTRADMLNSKDYRNAFMRNVLAGEAIPAQFSNANANTKTTDVGSVIPTTIMQRIVEKLESHGEILALVTRTSYKGGLSIPTSSAKPTASWVAEGATSDKQKKSTGSITFSYYKLRCAISVSLEVDTVSLDFFETVFVNQVTEAMIKALETAIISGDGSGKPKGILSETVVAGQNVDIAKTGSITYKSLWDMKKKVPSGYRNNVKWFMNYSTFCDIMSLVDTAGQPIARVNYGLNGDATASILGTPVVFSDDITADAASPSADTIVAFLFNPADYILNTNLAMTVKQYEDNDTEDKVTKAVMLVDGKVVDKNSLVTMTRKSAA